MGILVVLRSHLPSQTMDEFFLRGGGGGIKGWGCKFFVVKGKNVLPTLLEI